jgi:uncharacterized protein (DUF1778 family)
MPVPRPRTKLVNFRVSDEEYEALRSACTRHGARSISDFARLAVLGWAGSTDLQATAMQWRLSALGSKMAELEGRVGNLLGALDGRGSRGSLTEVERTDPSR